MDEYNKLEKTIEMDRIIQKLYDIPLTRHLMLFLYTITRFKEVCGFLDKIQQIGYFHLKKKKDKEESTLTKYIKNAFNIDNEEKIYTMALKITKILESLNLVIKIDNKYVIKEKKDLNFEIGGISFNQIDMALGKRYSRAYLKKVISQKLKSKIIQSHTISGKKEKIYTLSATIIERIKENGKDLENSLLDLFWLEQEVISTLSHINFFLKNLTQQSLIFTRQKTEWRNIRKIKKSELTDNLVKYKECLSKINKYRTETEKIIKCLKKIKQKSNNILKTLNGIPINNSYLFLDNFRSEIQDFYNSKDFFMISNQILMEAWDMNVKFKSNQLLNDMNEYQRLHKKNFLQLAIKTRTS